MDVIFASFMTLMPYLVAYIEVEVDFHTSLVCIVKETYLTSNAVDPWILENSPYEIVP